MNLLRRSRIHPHLSAYQSLCGTFDHARTLIASLGIKVIAYNSISRRQSWRVHSKLGCCIGPALNHYRYYNICILAIKKIITSDSIQCTEDNVFKVLFKSAEDNLLDSVYKLTNSIKNFTMPSQYVTNLKCEAMSMLKRIL